MSASEAAEVMPQTPDAQTNAAANFTEDWPTGLEISVEYCTRSPFHARYDPDKYREYFQSVSDAFQSRSAQTKIVGNPFTGRRRVWNVFEGAEEVEVPRLGAFEVTVNSEQTGEVNIFSKLETRHWPNLPVLVRQVDRLLRGEPLLQPTQSTESPRKRLENTSNTWQKSSTTPTATPRSPVSPERTVADLPSVSPKKTSPKKAASGRKEAPVTQEVESPPAAAQGANNVSQPTTGVLNLEDAQYGADEFEGDESGEGSSGLGAKVWMPGAARQEHWEVDQGENKDKPEENLPGEASNADKKDVEEQQVQPVNGAVEVQPQQPTAPAPQPVVSESPIASNEY